jgi:hypothetical protein
MAFLALSIPKMRSVDSGDLGSTACRRRRNASSAGKSGRVRASWFFVPYSPPVTVKLLNSRFTSPQVMAVASASRQPEYASNSHRSACLVIPNVRPAQRGQQSFKLRFRRDDNLGLGLFATLDHDSGILEYQALAHDIVQNLDQRLALDIESAGCGRLAARCSPSVDLAPVDCTDSVGEVRLQRVDRCLAPQTARRFHHAADGIQPALGQVRKEDGFARFGVEPGNLLA